MEGILLARGVASILGWVVLCVLAGVTTTCGGETQDLGDGFEAVGQVQQALLEDGAACDEDEECDSGHCCPNGEYTQCAACCEDGDCGIYHYCQQSCCWYHPWWMRGCCGLFQYYNYETDTCYSSAASCSAACQYK